MNLKKKQNNIRKKSTPGQSSQTVLAEFGIRMHMVLIPMLFYFIAFLAMWKMYSLTLEKVRENKEKLKAPLIDE
ncbi:MAG: hypothetical protein R6U96_11250 [Promethearchaeia archaeon]